MDQQHAADVHAVVGLPVEVDRDVAQVQRSVTSAALRQGLSTSEIHLAEIVAADMATRVVSHQGTGQMLVRFVERDDRQGIELLLSTADTGMHYEARPAEVMCEWDLFEVYTAPGKGTVMVAQVWSGPPTHPDDGRFLFGSMSDPIAGEVVSGDACAVEQRGSRLVALVADGLGHGEKAAVASQAAVSVFREHHSEPVERIAVHLHEALRPTRGAAIALVEIDSDREELRFCGIGNIAARLLLDDGPHELLSRYGIAGYQTQRIRTQTRPWSADAMLVMHSDGLSSRWDAAAYPGMQLQHPQLAAATVMRDAARADDDALVLAIRSSAEPGNAQRPEVQ